MYFLINCRLEECNFIKKRLRRRCFHVIIMKLFLRTPFLQNNLRETASKFLLKLFLIYFLFLLARFWSSVNSLSGYFERLCFFVGWFLTHWVIIAICFWQYICSKNWGSPLSWFLRQLISCEQKRKKIFSFSFCFSFLLSPSSQISIRTERNYVFDT